MPAAFSSTLDACLMCAGRAMIKRVPLRPIPIATPNFDVNAAGASDDELRAGVPLDLWQCAACGHVQVGEVGDPELQYRDYVYTTSLSLGLPEHFRRYGEAVIARYGLQRDNLVVELGSNDGTLLRVFAEAGMRVQGIDPARRIAAEATERGIPTTAEFFGSELASALRARLGPAGAIIANNVIANIRDLADVADGVRTLLADDGVFIFETQYGPDVVDGILLDTVYHEHLSYFFAEPTAEWLKRHDLEAIAFEHIPTKGGSIRVAAQHRGGPRPVEPSVGEWIARERSRGMFDQPFFDELTRGLARVRDDLASIVRRERAAGREIAGYGVSVGTTALLPQFDLTREIAFLVDDDPNKPEVLRGPDYAIPILRGQSLVERAPGAVIVFAWRYVDAIVARSRDYLVRGGSFVVPLPVVREVRA